MQRTLFKIYCLGGRERRGAGGGVLSLLLAVGTVQYIIELVSSVYDRSKYKIILVHEWCTGNEPGIHTEDRCFAPYLCVCVCVCVWCV